MKSLSLTPFALRWLSLLALAALVACGGAGDDRQLPKVFSATLTGAEETPPVTTAGKGVGALVFHPDDRSFTATVVTNGVAETVAHIHEGPPGVAGPIIFPLTKEPGSIRWKATGTLTPEQEATLKAGNYYFNVHSPTYPNGEIRGQITERALTPDQQQQLQQAIQQASSQLQQASSQIQAAQQAQQQQAQAAGAQGAPGGGTPGMGGTGTSGPY
jgi:hypothetical protein